MGAGASNFNLKTQSYSVENLAAAADISGRAVFFFPQAGSFQSAHIFMAANSAAIDANNTAVVTLKIANTAIATLTRTANTELNTMYALTNATGATVQRAANTAITMDVTQGTNADLPAFELVVVWNQDGLNT